MRLLVHVLVAVMIATIACGVTYVKVQQRNDGLKVDLARSEVARFQQRIHLQMALAPAEDGPPKPPASIDPAWFAEGRPENPLLGPEHPWVEVAGPQQKDRLHPPDLAAGDRQVAAFWYNPHNGIVRARVPAGISDERTLETYNAVNDTDLERVFEGE